MLACSPSGKEVKLIWTDRSDDETGFSVERNVYGSKLDFIEIAKLKADTCSFQDTTATAGSVYVYRVRAFNTAGKSTFAEVTVKAGGAPPMPPANKKIPAWNVPAQVVYSKAFPGFMDIEIYQEKEVHPQSLYLDSCKPRSLRMKNSSSRYP